MTWLMAEPLYSGRADETSNNVSRRRPAGKKVIARGRTGRNARKRREIRRQENPIGTNLSGSIRVPASACGPRADEKNAPAGNGRGMAMAAKARRRATASSDDYLSAL